MKTDVTFGHQATWSYQTASALAYLHRQTPPIIHRDLKPLNILLQDNCRIAKMCDFGLARAPQTSMTTGKGTLLWMAPEVMRGKHYTIACDIFSYGMTLWEIMTRERPFDELRDDAAVMYAVAEKKKRPPLNDSILSVIAELITKCWAEEPTQRPVMRDVEDTLQQMTQDIEYPLPPIELLSKSTSSSYHTGAGL
jgi:serine/threonine protein kinase